jgi:hypothetical protein
MSDDQSQDELTPIARTIGIIVFALCSGTVAFGAYVVFLSKPKQISQWAN